MEFEGFLTATAAATAGKDCGTKGKMYVRASDQIDLFHTSRQLWISRALFPLSCLVYSSVLGCCKRLFLSYSLSYKRGTGSGFGDSRRPGQLIMAENDPCPQWNVETTQSASSLDGFLSPRRNFPRTSKDGVPELLSGTPHRASTLFFATTN